MESWCLNDNSEDADKKLSDAKKKGHGKGTEVEGKQFKAMVTNYYKAHLASCLAGYQLLLTSQR